MSWSIVTYLTYATFYKCGSPYDQNKDKPAICEAIDPIKLDIISLFQSDYYKENLDPYIGPAANKPNEYYIKHGVPAKAKADVVYRRHVKPKMIFAAIKTIRFGQTKVYPFYIDHVAPLVIQAKPHIDKANAFYNKELKPLYDQALTKSNELKVYMQDIDNKLHPTALSVKKGLEALYHRIDNTDMMPLIIKWYWTTVDFYQFKVIPMIKHSQAFNYVKVYYSTNLKGWVDQHVTPLIVQINDKVHLDQLLYTILSHLPKRPAVTKKPVYTAKEFSTQAKTASTSVSQTQSVPVTSAATYKTVQVTTPVPASTTVASTTTHVQTTRAASTIAKYATDDEEDFFSAEETVASSSVRPQSTPAAVPDPKAAPDANKKEAIYVPTCNPDTEQVAVVNTDKNIMPVRSDKHVIAVPSEKEVFEVHQETTHYPAQPTSPTKHEDEKEQIVIQAPIPTEREEDMVFSILPVDDASATTEEMYSIQTEPATPLDQEQLIEDMEAVDQKMVEELKHHAKGEELKKENIYVPPVIQNEEVVLDTKKEDNSEPVFVKVEETNVAEEPVAPVVHVEEHDQPILDEIKANPDTPIKLRAPHPVDR